MCPTVENPDLVLQEMGNSQGLSHSRPTECGNRPAIQAGPDNSDIMVSPSRSFSVDLHQVTPTSNIPFCNEVQQVAPICVSPVPDS